MSQPYPSQPVSHPPTGQLVLNLRKPFGLLSSSMITPMVTIDGYRAPARWEQNAFPVVPGRHAVRVSANYLWEFGAAEQPVDIYPGQSVEVHYSPPLITFMRGKIGFTEQPRPGMAVFWAIIAVPVLAVIAVIIGIAVGS